MESFRLISRSADDTVAMGCALGDLARRGDVVLLVGDLGAGKTCLTQGIAVGLGVADKVTSPTFVIIREHAGRLPLYHIDFYRLTDVDEAADLGLDQYLYGDGVCVVEWADRAMGLFPAEHLLIELRRMSTNRRSLEMKASGARYVSLASELTSACSGRS